MNSWLAESVGFALLSIHPILFPAFLIFLKFGFSLLLSVQADSSIGRLLSDCFDYRILIWIRLVLIFPSIA